MDYIVIQTIKQLFITYYFAYKPIILLICLLEKPDINMLRVAVVRDGILEKLVCLD